QSQGAPISPANFIASSNSSVVEWELVKAGYGVSMLPEALCAGEAGLERVLPELPSLEFPIWLVTHRELHTSRRIRVVFDALAQGLMEVAARSN
ncbi:MAG: LysR substrate-binding domain-containing protein, partial [Pseudomonadota bacterium]